MQHEGFSDNPCCEDFYGSAVKELKSKREATRHGRDWQNSLVNAERQSPAATPLSKSAGATLVERIDHQRLFCHRNRIARLDRLS